jgi:hypothetical protein
VNGGKLGNVPFRYKVLLANSATVPTDTKHVKLVTKDLILIIVNTQKCTPQNV